MESTEQSMRTARRMFIGGICIALVGWLPLQWEIWFGPKDANPVGFGILAFLLPPSGLILAGTGLVYGIIALLLARKR